MFDIVIHSYEYNTSKIKSYRAILTYSDSTLRKIAITTTLCPTIEESLPCLLELTGNLAVEVLGKKCPVMDEIERGSVKCAIAHDFNIG